MKLVRQLKRLFTFEYLFMMGRIGVGGGGYY